MKTAFTSPWATSTAIRSLSCSVVVQGYRGCLPPEQLISPYPIPWAERRRPRDWAGEVEAKVTPLPRPIQFGA